MKHMKTSLLAGCILVGGVAFTAGAQAAPMACDGISPADLGVTDLSFTSVTPIPVGEESPVDHCLIQGKTADRTGDDGQTYAIRFELRLPDDWNGDFVHQFNGGNDGAVVPALGPLLGADGSDTALSRGYAVISSDAGHRSDAQADTGLVSGNRFGLDPEARRNYGYGAVATLNPLAVTMVESYYGDSIVHSYGVGGSNGGRHALVAAARMPEAFDGLLVGYPGLNLPKAAVQHAWDVQAFKPITGDIRTAFSAEDLTLVAEAMLAACDGLDGLEDGIISDAPACQSAFDITDLSCESGNSNQCLSAAQVTALQKIHAGPTNSAGEQLYSDWIWDRGIASGDWRFWKLESPIPPWGNMPLIAVMGSGSLAYLFTTPPTEVGGSPEELEQFLLDFDFDEDAPKIFATTENFPESAMAYMTPPGVEDPELAAFREAGGKMIIVHGNSDPVFSVADTIDWYTKLDANNGDDAESFARLYTVPGMPHGAGGPSTSDYDLMTPLVNWVENGEAPGAIVAGTAPESEGANVLGEITRKLCVYPEVARYTGDDPARAQSFTCE